MKETFRQSVGWLHTWAGLVVGWALFMMCLTGTAAVFKEEINVWMTPELGLTGDPLRAATLAQTRLEEVAPGARSWAILLPDERFPTTRISWLGNAQADLPAATAIQREELDARTGEPQTKRVTRGGDLFYRLHYRFEVPDRRGWWLAGAATVAMLVAMLTGVITHRRFFKDIFTFRLSWGGPRSWLDAHIFLAVLLLPFHLMIAYTGLVPIMGTIMPWGVLANYGDERPFHEQFSEMAFAEGARARAAYARDRDTPTVPVAASGTPGQLVPITGVLTTAQAHWEGGRAGRVSVSNPGDANAVIEVARHVSGSLSNRADRLFFSGTTGEFIGSVGTLPPVAKVQSIMYGMHMGRFAGPGLRWTYFLAGLATAAMVAAGLILWTVRRRARFGNNFGHSHQLVERINVGVIIGLPIAMAVYFWGNRLLPVDMASRAQAETLVFFLAWILALGFAVMRPLRRAWMEQMLFAALAYCALPLLNALTTDRNLLASIAAGDWIMAGFDVTMLVTGVLFAAAAYKTGRVTSGYWVGAPVRVPVAAHRPTRDATTA